MSKENNNSVVQLGWWSMLAIAFLIGMFSNRGVIQEPSPFESPWCTAQTPSGCECRATTHADVCQAVDGSVGCGHQAVIAAVLRGQTPTISGTSSVICVETKGENGEGRCSCKKF